MKKNIIKVVARALSAVIVGVGAASAPSVAWAQLGVLGGSTPVMSGVTLSTDVAFDPIHQVYLAVSAAGPATARFLDVNRNPIGDTFQLNTIPAGSPVYSHYPRVFYSRGINNGAGGFLVLWHQDDTPPVNVIHSRIVSYPAGPVGGDTVVNPNDGGSWWVAGAAAAYSPVSQRFLVVWQSCCGGFSTVRYRFVDLNGQPVGNVVQASGGYGREPGVAWNPVNGEFAISFDGEDATSPYTIIARVGADGTLLRRNIIHRSPGTYITDIAHNPATGRNVMVWFSLAGGTFAAETDAAGDVVATGLLSQVVGSYDGLGLAYNNNSGTFLLVGHHQTSLNVGGLELNKRGGRSSNDRVISSTSPPPGIGSFYPRPVSSLPSQWTISYSRDYGATMAQGVETISVGGAADSPIGPAPNPAPNPTPNPTPTPTPTPQPGGCAGGDPFAAIGGGTCVNGGWLPPGMGQPAPTPAPTPTPTPTPAPAPAPQTDCPGPNPFAVMNTGYCQNGGWQFGNPPTVPTPNPTPTPTPTPSPQPQPQTGCPGNDPFAAIGGGTCFNGGWYPPGVIAPAQTPTPTPTPNPGPGCLGPDPFAVSGGGTCVNGGWVPNSAIPVLCSGTPDPFVVIGGGVCINGGWVPRTAIGGGRP